MAMPYLSPETVAVVGWALQFGLLKAHVLRGCGPGGHRNSKQSRRLLRRMRYNSIRRKPWIPDEIRTLRELHKDLDQD